MPSTVNTSVMSFEHVRTCFRVYASGLGAWGFGFGAEGLGLRAEGRALACCHPRRFTKRRMICGVELRVWGSGLGVWHLVHLHEGEDTEEVVALCVEEVWDLLRVVVKAVALRYRVPVVGREELLVILVLYRV
jgi:hypothetical protein